MKTIRILLPVLVLTLAAFGAAMAADPAATTDTPKSMDCESCCCCKDHCDKAAHDKAAHEKAEAGHAQGEKGCC